MPPDALRSEEQDHDNSGKSNESGNVSRREGRQNTINKSKNQATHNSTWDAAQTTQDDHRNALHHGKTTHRRVNTE